MPIFMFFLPFILGLTVYRMYIENIWLRKVCKMKKKYIAKHNTGNAVMQLFFWNMKYDVDMIPYFLYLSCFIVPFLLPVLWLAAGKSGVCFYYSLCLVIFGPSGFLIPAMVLISALLFAYSLRGGKEDAGSGGNDPDGGDDPAGKGGAA